MREEPYFEGCMNSTQYEHANEDTHATKNTNIVGFIEVIFVVVLNDSILIQLSKEVDVDGCFGCRILRRTKIVIMLVM